MLPDTLMRQNYADNPPCVEMRNTKLHGVAYPDFRNYGNMCTRISHARNLRLPALRKFWHKVSLCRCLGLTVLEFM